MKNGKRIARLGLAALWFAALALTAFGSCNSADEAEIGVKRSDAAASSDSKVVWKLEALSPDADDDASGDETAVEGAAVLGLTFKKAVNALKAGDFTFTGVDGIRIETIGGSGQARTLLLSGVPASGMVKISLKKAGYTFSPSYFYWNIEIGTMEPGFEESGAAPELVSLVVEYTDEEGDLIEDFSPGAKTYVITPEAGREVKVSEAQPWGGASVSIRYNNGPLETGEPVPVPADGAEAKVVSVTAAKGALSSEYRVVIAPPQNGEEDDRSLMHLDVFYEGEQDSLIVFSKAITDYTVNVSQPKAASKVRVENIFLSSSKSVVTGIAYGVDRESAAAVAEGEPVTVPVTGSPAKKFFVTVQSADGNTQSYIVTINPYTPAAQKTTWSGTVTLNALTGKTAVQVTVRGADAHQSHTAAVSDGNWTLNAPVSFAPVSFIVSITDAFQTVQSLALERGNADQPCRKRSAGSGEGGVQRG